MTIGGWRKYGAVERFDGQKVRFGKVIISDSVYISGTQSKGIQNVSYSVHSPLL